MADVNTNKETTEQEKLKQIAAQMRANEYKGLSEEEIQKKEQQKEMRKKRNREILNDTLNILENGCYEKAGRAVNLNFSYEQIKSANVFLPDEIDSSRVGFTKYESEISGSCYENINNSKNCCTFSCKNTDAFSLAWERYQNCIKNGESDPGILVLNLASSTHPGGRVREGANAQEEDLCRKSSLLISLESEDAKKYYNYNNALKTHMGSDAIILSPNVEVVKDSASKPLSSPYKISVISCAAPMIRLGLEGMTEQKYKMMFYKRIQGILLVASAQKYRHLILGAFGCGVYGNDAAVVSDLFFKAITDFESCTLEDIAPFKSIDFAVLCPPDNDYNYKEFYRNFSLRTFK